MPYKNVDDLNLDGPHTLAELLQRIAPLTYRCWARIKSPAPWPINGRVNINSVLDWTPRMSVVARRRVALLERLSDYVRDALASRRYKLAGTGPDGNRLDIDRDLANQLVIDLDGNTLRIRDGGFVWRAISVRMTTPPEAGAPKRRAGAKPSKSEAVKGYVRKHYPDGVPHDVKNESIAAANRCHEKTVRRALMEMGQNTDR